LCALACAALPAMSCAPRPVMCQTAAACGPNAACVAHLCQGATTPNVIAKSRRIVRNPTEIAFIARDNALAAGDLPYTVALGNAGGGPAAVLLRFDMPSDVEVLEAYLLVDRALDARDGDGVGVHAERIVGAWSARTATWLDGPELSDVRAPSLLLRRGTPLLVRLDVRPLLARPHGAEPPDQGIALVADTRAGAGASFVLAPSLSSASDADGTSAARAPRLELYVK
jgi:hypothetical protein